MDRCESTKRDISISSRVHYSPDPYCDTHGGGWGGGGGRGEAMLRRGGVSVHGLLTYLKLQYTKGGNTEFTDNSAFAVHASEAGQSIGGADSDGHHGVQQQHGVRRLCRDRPCRSDVEWDR